MFNSSLAQEMTAYIELRSAAFSDSLVSNDKRVLLSLDQYLVRAGFQEKSLTEEVLKGWAKTLSGKSKTVKEKARCGAWLRKISECNGICFISSNATQSEVGLHPIHFFR